MYDFGLDPSGWGLGVSWAWAVEGSGFSSVGMLGMLRLGLLRCVLDFFFFFNEAFVDPWPPAGAIPPNCETSRENPMRNSTDK